MSKKSKALAKLKSATGTFEWADMVAALKALGFEQVEMAGSRVRFVKGDLQILLHKPHPQKEMKAYAVRQVKELLRSEGSL